MLTHLETAGVPMKQLLCFLSKQVGCSLLFKFIPSSVALPCPSFLDAKGKGVPFFNLWHAGDSPWEPGLPCLVPACQPCFLLLVPGLPGGHETPAPTAVPTTHDRRTRRRILGQNDGGRTDGAEQKATEARKLWETGASKLRH